eukprot:1479612-Pyramimonas_sp.AAC.1
MALAYSQSLKASIQVRMSCRCSSGISSVETNSPSQSRSSQIRAFQLPFSSQSRSTRRSSCWSPKNKRRMRCRSRLVRRMICQEDLSASRRTSSSRHRGPSGMCCFPTAAR